MNILYKKKFILALLVSVVSATNFLNGSVAYYNIEAKLAAKDKISFDAVKKEAAEYEKAFTPQDDALVNSLVKRGTINLGKDAAGKTITLAYITAGDKNACKGTMFGADALLGSESYAKQAALWAQKGYFSVFFDPLGFGLSSKNDPVAMDGIGGFDGYSLQQFAYLYHQALIKLGVQPNSAAHPITVTGLDFMGTVALVYCYQYKTDPYGPSFYIAENVNYSAVVSDDPCTTGLITTPFADAILGLYANDPCSTLCLLYSGTPGSTTTPGNFTEPNCPQFGAYLLHQSVSIGALTPLAITTRQLLHSLSFDPTPLIAQITIPVLMIEGGIFQDLPIKKINGIGLYGWCGACTAGCTNTNYVLPFPNSIFIAYQDAAIECHVTRTQRFNDDVTDFITGKAGKCDPYFGYRPSASANCPVCPTA